MDQGRGLEGLAGLLLGQFLQGQAAELLIDHGQEVLCRLGGAFLYGTEDTSDFVHKTSPEGDYTSVTVIISARSLGSRVLGSERRFLGFLMLVRRFGPP